MQKAIDDLQRELSEKADWMQIVSLRNDINKNLEILRQRVNDMLEIVGEPKAAVTSKKLFRDTACLSCATPAQMDMEKPDTFPTAPAFPAPRPPTLGAEASPSKEDKDERRLCYPGYPLPHPREPRYLITHDNNSTSRT